jgi:hypothetical protein
MPLTGSIGWEGECIQEKGKQKMGCRKWAQDMIVSQEVYRQYWMGRRWMGRRMYTGEGKQKMGCSKWAQDMIVGSRWVGSFGWEGGGWEGECIQEKVSRRWVIVSGRRI